MASDADLRQLFDSLDLNRNGVLTRGELITALRVKGRQASDSNSITFWGFKDLDDAADFFDQSDVDHNREVTYEEFAKAMNARKAADA